MSYTYGNFKADFPEIRQEKYFDLRRDGLYLAKNPTKNLPDKHRHIPDLLEEKDLDVFEDHPDGMPAEPILKFGENYTHADVARRFVCHYGMHDFCVNEGLLKLSIEISEKKSDCQDASMGSSESTPSGKAKKAVDEYLNKDYGYPLTEDERKCITVHLVHAKYGRKHKGEKANPKLYPSKSEMGIWTGIIQDDDYGSKSRDAIRGVVRRAIEKGKKLCERLQIE